MKTKSLVIFALLATFFAGSVMAQLKHVSVGNGWVWGVNGNDQIFKCKQPCTGSWVHVTGSLKQIDVSDATFLFAKEEY